MMPPESKRTGSESPFIKPPLLPNEDARLQSLFDYDILDSGKEELFQDLVKLASEICGTPVGLITLVDRHRQWFKAKINLNAQETPRGISFCGHAIAQDDLFMIPDARKDDRFAQNPMVIGDPYIRFYAGVPIRTPHGQNLGTLCVIDHVPRILSEAQQELLAILARQVMSQIELRRKMAQLEVTLAQKDQAEFLLRNADQRFRAFMNGSPMIAFMKDSKGRMVYYNKPCADRFEITETDWIGKTDFERWPESAARSLHAHDLRVLAENKTVVFDEVVPSPQGRDSHWKSYKFPFVDTSGERYVAGMTLDVTSEREQADALRHSEKKFKDLLDTMHEMVQSIGPDGRVLFANRAWREKLGYTEEEVWKAALFRYRPSG